MTPATLLAALREPGRTDEQVLELLAAIAASLPADDKTTQALDVCIDAIEDIWLTEILEAA